MTSIVLALVGVALFLAAIKLYSSPGDLPATPYATLELTSTFSIGGISYDVRQVSPSIAEIFVSVELIGGVLHPPAKAPAPILYMLPPPGTAFRTCPIHICTPEAFNTTVWTMPLSFKPGPTYQGDRPITGIAYANFFVRAHNFGVAFNGVNASAAIPQVFYLGPGTPTLITTYENVPSASSYDWSAFPTEFVNGTTAVWDEPVASGAAPGKVAIGINRANQTKNNNKVFFAGALIGLAGGALLSAVQEALHAND